MNEPEIPLVVDLDGALIKTDLLLEGSYAMIKENPLLILRLPSWLLRGKVYFKDQVAKRVRINVRSLPYHADFLEYLRKESSRGRKLILATASVKKLAESVSNHLGIFSDVLASADKINLSGREKLKVLLERYGEKGFDYAGNARPDLHIFPHARNAILVNPASGVLSAARKTSNLEQLFNSGNGNALVYFKAARTYQWVKNLLLFVPLTTSHNWNNSSAIASVVLGFVSFSLCASGGYIFNDLFDLAADRNHPRKRHRPFANGDIPIWNGSALMLVFQVIGLSIAFALNRNFFALLVVYLLINFAYTFHLKTFVLIDVLVLAGLYTLRIISGSILANVPLSFWLLAFSIFLFFSLALVKRCSELLTLSKNNSESAHGRDYNVSDMGYLREMGIASGYLAILIVAFYINSSDVALLYSRPKMLWMVCPALFYWISRIWLKTGRGEMVDDPIVFAIKDKGSRIVLEAILFIILLAI